MIELEVVDEAGTGIGRHALEDLAARTLAAAGVGDGHLSVHFVSARRMRALNAEHRGLDEATDVLSFPVDEAGPSAGPRLLGDVFVCPAMVQGDLSEGLIHGLLHLAGMDHDTDGGEMLALQERLHRRLGGIR